MESITIYKIDEIYMKIVGERSVLQDISEEFTFFADNYKFMKKYKSGIWDGKIRLLNPLNGRLYVGLLHRLFKVCKELDYKVKFDNISDFSLNQLSIEDVKDFIQNINLPFSPREYQVNSLYDCIQKKRLVVLSPTGSGKSLIIYMFIRWFLSQHPNEKMMLIVPNVSLVHQIYNDFEDYSSDNLWDVEKFCQKIYSGQEKLVEKNVAITTWQSIYRLPPSYFKAYRGVIVDEAHQAKASSLTNILGKMRYAEYRIGTTGTLDDINVHQLTLEGLFGVVRNHVTTKKLIDDNYLSDFKIKFITLKYPEDECKEVCKMDYVDEIDFILDHPKRNKFIKNLCGHLKGNTLVLYTYVEKHGDLLSEILEELPDKEVFYIHGKIDAKIREKVRKKVEDMDNALILASYGTFSTGINIKNLHNVIFASPTKSKIRSLQSIGRGLRLGDDKESCILFDLCDDFSFKKKTNYMIKHGTERMKIYIKEDFEIESVTVSFTEN